MTFGELIADAQYLNDLEHDRRNPPSEVLLKQFARILNLDLDALYHLAGKLPKDIREAQAPPDRLEAAYKAFRKALENKR